MKGNRDVDQQIIFVIPSPRLPLADCKNVCRDFAVSRCSTSPPGLRAFQRERFRSI
jgi:hypothetical protein